MIVLGVVAVGGIGLFVGTRNPDTAAKVKCEFGVEEATALRIGVADVARATVTGDEFNGTVQMRFNAGSTPYTAECIFEHGRFRRVSVNGEIVAGR